MAKKYFELIEGKSAKFWHAELNGDTQVVRYGRIGTKGRETEKSYANPAVAKLTFEKLIQQKLAKGYVKVNKAQGETHTQTADSKTRSGSSKKPTKKGVTKSRRSSR